MDASILKVLRRNSAESTKKLYFAGVVHFCRFLNLKPFQAVEKFRNMSDDERLELIREYVVYCRDRLSKGSIHVYLSSIKVWLIENNIDLDSIENKIRRILKQYIGGKNSRLKDYISKDTIKKLLITADNMGKLRFKTAITILASSGIRVGSL
ncbi:MAG: hypothetical protein NDF56_07920, partial [archaeon GB-1845-036]|nr:hypothetical protein [Candidatus Culexmicrobium thermophilum]